MTSLNEPSPEGDVRTIPPGERRGMVTVPSSKSIAHRELIAAALSGVPAPVIRGESRDTRATRACLAAMLAGEREWPCGESGTTYRLLEPLAGVMGWRGEFRCEGRLASRPRLPFERKPRYVIPGNVSSQFVSGLLMALPLAAWDGEIAVEGALQGLAYVRLTEDVLRAAGIRFDFRDTPEGPRWAVPGGQRYHIAGGREVEGDWSQAAFFFAMGGVEVRGLSAQTRQGDAAVTGLLAAIRANPRGGSLALDCSSVPDLVPALAAAAAGGAGDVRFTGCGRLRLKESDRLETTAAMVRAVGGEVAIDGDALVVSGGRPLAGGVVDACNDHRIAMASAVLARFCRGPVTVRGASCVAKSYPGFWDDLARLEVVGPC